MGEHYILKDGEVIPVDDVLTWARWFGSAPERIIAKAKLTTAEVSTVFLGLNHNFGTEGPPLLFETMVFGGTLDQEMERYATLEEAMLGHEQMVGRVLKAEQKD